MEVVSHCASKSYLPYVFGRTGSSKQCTTRSDAAFWVYTVCNSYVICLDSLIDSKIDDLFKVQDKYGKVLKSPNT